MDKREKHSPAEQLEEWERIHQEESGLSLAERKTKQLVKLSQMVQTLKSLFGTNLVSITKLARGEKLNEDETARLKLIPEQNELLDRVKGLIKVFAEDYYLALEQATGKSFVQVEKAETPVVEPVEEEGTEIVTESGRVSKLPKGYNKWDLKLIKLHESKPTDGKRIWVEYWSLKGISEIGEILYNPTKDLFYFKPYNLAASSFALTDEHGRKATVQAKNYYFRVAPNPPVIEKELPPKGV